MPAPLFHPPGAALPAARTLRLQPRGLAGSSGYHPGSGRGWRRLGRRWPAAASSLGTAGSEGPGMRGALPGRAGPAGAAGRGGSLLPKLRVAGGDSIAFIL